MAGRKSKYSNVINKDLSWSVAAYIRLSQEDSDNGKDKLESNSVVSQKELLNQYISEYIDLNLYNTYIDDGYTGTDFERPGFQRLLCDMKKGYINCIVVKDLSRLGRNYIEVGNYIEQIFPLFNVRFIAINDNIDSYKMPSSLNTILVPFKNLINDEYARDTSIKIKSALNGRRKKGEYIGAFASYGYVKSKEDNHKLIIDEEAAQIVRKIFDWKVNKGFGNLSICHKLNDMGILNPTGYKIKKLGQKYTNSKIKEDYSWCPSTIRNILKNDVYIGNITQGKRRVKSYKIHKVEQVSEDEWVTVEKMHEPIISKKLFNKAQSLRQIDTRVEKNGNLSIWAGMLKCADCGRSMHKKYCKNKIGKVYEYYICGTYRKKSNMLCTKHTIRQDELEEFVLKEINRRIQKIDINGILENIKESGKSIDINIDDLKKSKEEELKRVEKLKNGLYEDWKNGYITEAEYVSYKEKYNDSIENISKIILNLSNENEKVSNNKKWVDELKVNKKVTELNREIIHEFIEFIDVFENKKLMIHFK